MSSINQQLENYLKCSTVKILIPGGYGTGFFVADDLILTCAHVVRKVGDTEKQLTIQCFRGDKKYQAKIEQIIVGEQTLPLKMHYPDIAILRVFPPLPNQYACVYLDGTQPQVEIEAGDHFSVFGYTSAFRSGEPLDLICTGRTGDPDVLRFRDDQILKGASGAPALNRRTWKVCGIINYSRDVHSDLGGYAIPIDVVYNYWSEIIVHAHDHYHQQHPSWKELLPDHPSESPIQLAIQAFGLAKEENKPIFVMHGNVSYLEDLMNSFYEHFSQMSDFPFLLLDIQTLKRDTLEDILCDLVQELIEQFVKKLEDSNKLIELNKISWALDQFRQTDKSSWEKSLEFQDFKDLFLYPGLRKVCEKKSIIIVLLRQFGKIGNLKWSGHIKKELLDPLLQNLKDIDFRFFIQSTEVIKKSEIYHGSAELYALNNVKFYELAEKD